MAKVTQLSNEGARTGTQAAATSLLYWVQSLSTFKLEEALKHTRPDHMFIDKKLPLHLDVHQNIADESLCLTGLYQPYGIYKASYGSLQRALRPRETK